MKFLNEQGVAFLWSRIKALMPHQTYRVEYPLGDGTVVPLDVYVSGIPSDKGTLSTPYTTSEILHDLSAGRPFVTVHVKGKIKEVRVIDSEGRHATYVLTDGTVDFVVSQGKSFGGADVAYEYQFAVGDEVVVRGHPLLDKGVPGFSGGSVVVSQVRTHVVSLNKYGTICLPYDFEVEGGRFYEVTDIQDSELVMNEVAKPVAGMPYLLQTDGGVMRATFIPGPPVPAGESTYMVGVAAATQAPVGTCVLQTIDGVQKFRVVAEGEQPNIPAGRAYFRKADVSVPSNG